MTTRLFLHVSDLFVESIIRGLLPASSAPHQLFPTLNDQKMGCGGSKTGVAVAAAPLAIAPSDPPGQTPLPKQAGSPERCSSSAAARGGGGEVDGGGGDEEGMAADLSERHMLLRQTDSFLRPPPVFTPTLSLPTPNLNQGVPGGSRG